MRYFFVSDIHGEYDKLVQALQDEGFNAKEDTLVSLGDPFDRGSKSREVLDFIMSCPHRIIVMGNHDWRLLHLMHTPVLWDQYDIYNGVTATYKSFLGIPQDEPYMAWEGLTEIGADENLHQYYEEAVLYVEFADLIAVHGWVPFLQVSYTDYKPYNKGDADGPNWREASKAEWYDAVWANTAVCVMNEIYPEKRLIVGHWHAWRLAEEAGECRHHIAGEKNWIDCDIYFNEHLVAIDGCTNLAEGKVNVLVYETDELPSVLRYKDLP